MVRRGERVDHGDAIGADSWPGRHRLALDGCTECGPIWDDWMQSPISCKSDRLQVSRPRLAVPPARGIRAIGWIGVNRVAAVFAVLVSPVLAQTPNINLIPELKSMTPEEKEQEAAQQKAYKESLKKIPEAKVSSDPWGNVRSSETPKDVSRTSAPPKPRTKSTGAQTKTETR